ncbi:MAG: hypothetical protein FWG58_01055 [Methanomassiliicoccaceae archaeon]|nr:hypothetical protein [Methanomassiliicoccaceae archaeon]
MEVPLEAFKDIQVISSDAYEVGEVVDIRYDPFEWNVAGLRIRSKRSSNKLAAGFGKANVMILPEKFVMNDVMLLSQTIERLKDSLVPDNDNIASLSPLINAKVVTKDNMLVGSVVTIMIDTDNWKVMSMVIRLDKQAIEAMGLKKGFFAKINAEIPTDIILSSAEMIHLSEQIDGVKERMTILE